MNLEVKITEIVSFIVNENKYKKSLLDQQVNENIPVFETDQEIVVNIKLAFKQEKILIHIDSKVKEANIFVTPSLINFMLTCLNQFQNFDNTWFLYEQNWKKIGKELVNKAE